MASKSWNVETDADGTRKIVESKGWRTGRFESMRAAVEYVRGRVMYRGHYRTHEEIKDLIAKTPVWRDAQCERTQAGWRFIHYTGAELFLRAA